MSQEIGAVGRDIRTAIYVYWQVFLAEGLLMFVLGLLAIALPEVASVAVLSLVGWLFLIGGVLRITSGLASRSRPGFRWSLLSPVVAALVGLWLLIDPIAGLIAATALIAAYFVVDGVVKILLAIELRQHLERWTWPLLAGIVDLLLALLITIGWPGSAGWVLGLMAGINMTLLGLALVMTASDARRKIPAS